MNARDREILTRLIHEFEHIQLNKEMLNLETSKKLEEIMHEKGYDEWDFMPEYSWTIKELIEREQ